ncbi:hypothetical protein, partial [Arachnia propionica]|uniref:hypothetical protein n=1 Tax=Arachnia propionica TaxID=1750 RepID=UPI0028E8C790
MTKNQDSNLNHNPSFSLPSTKPIAVQPYRSIWFCGWFRARFLVGWLWGLVSVVWGFVGVAGSGNAAASMFL